MTIQEALNEFDMFTCSKEYFDILKESAELKLQAHYIATQNYLAEYASDTAVKTLTESGILMESASSSDLEAITEAFKDKVTAVWTKVKEVFKKAIKAMCAFFKKLIGKKNTQVDADKVMAHEFTDDDFNAIEQLLKEHGYINATDIVVKGGIRKVVTSKDMTKNPTDTKLVRNAIYFVYNKWADFTHQSDPNAISILGFMNILKKYGIDGNGANDDFSVKSLPELAKDIKAAKKFDKDKIHVNYNTMDDKERAELVEKFDKLSKFTIDFIDNYATAADAVDDANATKIQAVAETLSADMTAIASDTIKFYNGIDGLYIDLVNLMNKLVK